MSRAQWGHGFLRGRLHEKVAHEATKLLPELLDQMVGKDNWFRVQNKKLYLALNPRYNGDGIGLMIIKEDGSWTCAELREKIIAKAKCDD